VPHPGVLICIIVLIVVGPIGSILAALRFWPDFATPADHWALLGAVFAGGAVWEGALAGIIAIAAFWLASERPALSIGLAAKAGLDRSDISDPLLDLTVSVRLNNASPFSGRSPAVRLHTYGLKLDSDRVAGVGHYMGSAELGWLRVEPTLEGAGYAFLWRGGAGDVVHGPNWPYDIPPLQLAHPGYTASDVIRFHVDAVVEGDRAQLEYTAPTSPSQPTRQQRASAGR
jgi:hypothetical protein